MGTTGEWISHVRDAHSRAATLRFSDLLVLILNPRSSSMPVCFKPSRFTLYLTGTDQVSTQRLTRSGGPKYSLSPARAQGSPIPPDGLPFTCSDPRPTAMTATL